MARVTPEAALLKLTDSAFLDAEFAASFLATLKFDEIGYSRAFHENRVKKDFFRACVAAYESAGLDYVPPIEKCADCNSYYETFRVPADICGKCARAMEPDEIAEKVASNASQGL